MLDEVTRKNLFFNSPDITDSMLYLANGTVVGSTERDIMREIKERHGYIALDYMSEEKLNKTISYMLPDDNCNSNAKIY
jgi:hypothetical protein